jgi:hypothetical protein
MIGYNVSVDGVVCLVVVVVGGGGIDVLFVFVFDAVTQWSLFRFVYESYERASIACLF